MRSAEFHWHIFQCGGGRHWWIQHRPTSKQFNIHIMKFRQQCKIAIITPSDGFTHKTINFANQVSSRNPPPSWTGWYYLRSCLGHDTSVPSGGGGSAFPLLRSAPVWTPPFCVTSVIKVRTVRHKNEVTVSVLRLSSAQWSSAAMLALRCDEEIVVTRIQNCLILVKYEWHFVFQRQSMTFLPW